MATRTEAPKILVVDDEPKWLRLVSLYLGSRHCLVTTAVSGEEALQKVAQDQPDLVIADITMPGMDGYELCSRLRRDPATRVIPFIFLTARDQDQDRIKARKVGSDDYLTKPCPLERLLQSVETAIDRIDQAKRIPLDQIGLSGHLDAVDLLDLIQTLELNQKTGALVLSHGERTATLYFKEGLIVEADIRSPKREEPLFVLLGWKTGRYLFIPDSAPDRMPITASMANLLLQDLLAMERREQEPQEQTVQPIPAEPSAPEVPLVARVLARIDEVARHRASPATLADMQVVRLLVVGVAGSGTGDLIRQLVKDLSRSRWAAVGTEEGGADTTEFGRVAVSNHVVLHLIAVRAEKRFWSVWEQCLPGAIGAVVVVNSQAANVLPHVHAFLRARDTLAPTLPVHVLQPAGSLPSALPGLTADHLHTGPVHDTTVRLTVLDRLLEEWLATHSSAR